MNPRKDDCTDIEQDQISLWLKQPCRSTAFYEEPKLQESTVEVIKLVCDVLQQTDEVFITSVDILEKYLHIAELHAVDHCNSLIIICCGVLMSSKLIGSYPEIKIASIQRIILKLSHEEIERNVVKQTELDMLLTLGKLPLSTAVTDLGMFLQYYIRTLKLRVDIRPLCMETLNVVYICRKRLFYQLKSVYTKSVDALRVFRHLQCNKFYYPGGIVLCALKVTKFKNTLNVQEIGEDISRISTIHYDHLQLLANAISELIRT